MLLHFAVITRKPWRKRRKRKRRPRQSLIPSISWFSTSAAQLWPKRRKSLLLLRQLCVLFYCRIHWFVFCFTSLQKTGRWPSLYVVCWYYGKGETSGWAVICSSGQTSLLKQNVTMWSCICSLTSSSPLPPELPHWWGRRRGRARGGGAILWGATDRDGMGGPGEGKEGSQRRSNSPSSEWPHHVITPGTPPHQTYLVFSLLAFHTVPISCCGGLTCACLCWTPVDSVFQNRFHLLNCMTWVQRDSAAKDKKKEQKLQSKQTIGFCCLISESQFPSLVCFWYLIDELNICFLF